MRGSRGSTPTSSGLRPAWRFAGVAFSYAAILLLGVAPLLISAQGVDADILRLKIITDDNARRISKLEEVKDFGSRIAVLEDNMFEIKWLSRSVAAALVIQLVMGGMRLKKSSEA